MLFRSNRHGRLPRRPLAGLTDTRGLTGRARRAAPCRRGRPGTRCNWPPPARSSLAARSDSCWQPSPTSRCTPATNPRAAAIAPARPAPVRPNTIRSARSRRIAVTAPPGPGSSTPRAASSAAWTLLAGVGSRAACAMPMSFCSWSSARLRSTPTRSAPAIATRTETGGRRPRQPALSAALDFDQSLSTAQAPRLDLRGSAVHLDVPACSTARPTATSTTASPRCYRGEPYADTCRVLAAVNGLIDQLP